MAPTALALGVSAGGRTGLAALVTAGLFLLSLFLYPLVRMIGAGYPVGQTTLYPVIAPPLALVGTMMLGGLRHVPWDEPTEAIPAFLTIVMMPMAFSIYRRVGLRVGFVRDPGPSGPTRLTPGKIGPARLRVCRSLHCPIRAFLRRRAGCYNFLFDGRQITRQVRSFYSDEGADL